MMAAFATQFPPGTFEVNPVDAHPNPTVHAAIAERLAHWFEEHRDLLEADKR